MDIIDYQGKVLSDMARIVGRYKGATTLYAEELARIAQDRTLNKAAKARIEAVVDRLFNTVADNEELWAKRGKGETAL